MVRNFFAAITRFSVRFQYITVAISLLAIILGLVGYSQFNQELLPSVEFPQTYILVQSPGLAADELLALITIPLEREAAALENVLNVESTTGAGFGFVQVSNEFGIDQSALQARIRDRIGKVWKESGLARAWNAVDVNALNTTADLTAAVINEAVARWPYLLDDLTEAHLLSLPPEAAAALPPDLIDALPGETQAAVRDIAAGQRAPDAPVNLPQSWKGLSRTTDLTPETVERILAVAPTMAGHFRNNEGDLIESYLFAMPPDVIRALPEDLTAGLSACSRQQLDAVIAGDAPPDPPTLLPGAWRASPPALITFSLSDLPLAFVSVSGEFTQQELRQRVESEIIPRLENVEGVARITAQGGQVLPGNPDFAEVAVAAVEAPAEASGNPGEGTPSATPFWRLIGSQIGAALGGQAIENYEDLTPELTNLTLTLVDGLNVPLVSRRGLIAELQSQSAIDALPAETLAWMPADFSDTLSDDLKARADARVAAETRFSAVGEAARTAEAEGKLPVYFRLFAALGKQFGLPLTLKGPEDLTPEIVAALSALAPGGAGVQLLRPLGPEAWAQVPAETLGWLPADFAETLDADARAVVEARAEAVGSVGALAAAAEQRGDLPPFFALLARQPLLGGARICGPEDLSPELISAVGSFMPAAFESLSPATLERLSPAALAALPPAFVEDLPDDLRATLSARAESAGGLASAAGAGADSGAPAMPASWDDPRLPKTAADLVNSQFGGASGFLNTILQFDAETAKSLYADLTPEIVSYLIENEEGFLDKIDPAVLGLFSQDVINSLPEQYREIAANAFIPDAAVTRTNGQRSLLLTVYKNTEANTVAVSHRLFEELDAIESELEGVEIEVGFEQSSFIEESISGVTREGALGAIFAVIVIFFFLNRNWRSTIVTAISIPLSVMIALALMHWVPPLMNGLIAPLAESQGGLWAFLVSFFPSAVTLNLLTLSGLTVAIGRVVDDSIVVLENVYRHIQHGENPLEAVIGGTREVSIAILASTVTTVIVFLPIGLTGGLIGAFFLPFGLAASYALGASFVVAITTIPVLAKRFVRKADMPEEKETLLQRAYTPALKWALSHRAAVLGIAAVLFVASMGLLVQRPRTFIPPFGEPQITVNVTLPQGTGIIQTNALVLEMENYVQELQDRGEVETYRAVVGSGGVSLAALLGSAGVEQNAAQITAAMRPGNDLDRLTGEVRARAEAIFGAENVTVSAATIAEQGFGGLGLVLSGDPETLREIDADVKAALSEIEGVTNLTSSFELASQAGDAVILRVDGEPAVQYTAEFETDDTLGVTALAKDAVVKLLAEKGLSEAVHVSEGFQTEVQTSGFSQIIVSQVLAIVVVYFVMVLTFRSFLHPFTILFSLPLAVVGAAVALWLTDRVLGLPAMVGMLMLVGIVVTNAIVLIDRVQQNRKERGMNAHDALVEGGRTRLRPILMTALAAIFALLPLATQIMGSGGAIVAAELGTVVIGGLTTSTFLTLLVVPVVYSLLDEFSSRLRGRAS